MSNKKEKVVEPKFVTSLINNPMLNYKVYVLNKKQKVLYFIISVLFGGVAGMVFFSGFFKQDGESTLLTYISNAVIFIIVGLIVSRVFFPTFVAKKKTKRDTALRDQFRDLLDSLSASFSSGVNSSEAFKSAYTDMIQQHGESSIIAMEMKEILDGINQNYTISQMLCDFAERSGNEDIESFANVYQIAIEKGSDLKTVIRRTHSIISDKIAVNDEIQTKLASNKLQHTVMSIMPIGIVAILRFTNDSFATSFTSPLGIIVNIVAIGAFIGSYILGQKICDIK